MSDCSSNFYINCKTVFVELYFLNKHGFDLLKLINGKFRNFSCRNCAYGNPVAHITIVRFS